jgi:hypothetical protein
MRRTRRALTGAVLAGTLTFTACGSSGGANGSTAPESTTTTVPGGTKEVALLSGVPPVIAALVTALQGGDVAKAQRAYEDYDASWNGVEVYVNVRRKDLYDKLEGDLQAKIAAGLAAAAPNLAALVPLAQQLATGFDEAIATSKAGPALSPSFDDLTRLRIIRADVRRSTSALKAGNLPQAKETFATFASSYPEAAKLIALRSDTAGPLLSTAIDNAKAGFANSVTTTASLTALVAVVTDRYNAGVNLWNAAARNADLTKTTYTAADLDAVTALYKAKAALAKSLTAWKSTNYTASSAALAEAGAAFATAQPALAAKKADTSPRTALDTYAPLSAAAGTEAAVAVSNRSASESLDVAVQVLVGQFWTDAGLQAAIKKRPSS